MTNLEDLIAAAAQIASKPNVLSYTFPQQKRFIEDPARLKALFCTRRAAKSYTAGLYLINESLNNPGKNFLFLGLTRESAKGIVWKDILKNLNLRMKLGLSFNETTLQATFPNGSVIYVSGVDVSEDEMNKLLGRKYRLACVDEGSMYTVDLHKLIYGILKPAIADDRGTICMMGTASNFTRGLFYDITTGREPGWSLHTWSAHDNPHVANQWAEELSDIRTNRPLFMDTPLYRQWYLNEWVIDTERLVYKFNPDKNLFNKPPEKLNPNGWTYILGVDLGYEDDSAFVLCGFHEHDKVLYVLNTYNRKHMDITDVANRIKTYRDDKTYPIAKVIIDGANKQAVEEMQRRHGVALQAADKTGKADFIEIMNAELIQAKIMIKETLSNLTQEMMGLVWMTDGDKIKLPKKEHPALPNHLCDALLYAWRYCYQYMSAPEEKKPIQGSKEWYAQQFNVDAIWEAEREHLQSAGQPNLWPDSSNGEFQG